MSTKEPVQTKEGHVLYTAADFTGEELRSNDKLIIAVVEGGLAVCKKCGEYEAGLDAPCKAKGLTPCPTIK